MRLSEAIRLGSLAIQNPRAGDTRYCAIGMGLEAIGRRDMTELQDKYGIHDNYRANYDSLASAWPWVLQESDPVTEYKTKLYRTFDTYVMSGRMTLEAFCDTVAGWERDCESKGFNVEQVTMIATPEATHEPATEHTESLATRR
jgi:hypothetical protein